MPIDAHSNCSKLRIFVCKKIVSCFSAAASGQGQPLARDGPGAWWLAEALPLFPPYSFFFDQDGCSSSCQCHLLGVRRGCRAGHSPYGLHCPHQVGFSTTRIHVEHIRSYNELWAMAAPCKDVGSDLSLLASSRPDIVRTIHTNMNKNKRQAVSVHIWAGKNTAAESWGTGRAVSRIPRVPGGGTHRAGQGAFGNMCRGGRMFAPTKVWRRWHRKINITQKRHAVASALAASALPSLVMARGHKIDQARQRC